MKTTLCIITVLLSLFIENGAAIGDIQINVDENDLLTQAKEFTIWNPFTSPAFSIVEEELPWKYEDQENWKNHYPTCGGNRQSPIALDKKSANVINKGTPLEWSNYQNFHLYLTLNNNGHTIDASSTFKNTPLPELRGGPLNGTYKFSGIHWHWGSGFKVGAEHNVNSDLSPLEMHAVHYNSKFASFQDAVKSGESEALVVVGVLHKVSVLPNLGLKIITNTLTTASTPGEQKLFLPLGYIGLNFNSQYFSYLGSLTSPPCNQIVRWIVLEKPIMVTIPQLLVFQNILVNENPLVNNYRQLQNLNGRIVDYYQ